MSNRIRAHTRTITRAKWLRPGGSFSTSTQEGTETHLPLFLRPGDAAGQHREFHRCSASSHRSGRSTPGQRRARPRRVLHPACHDRGNAGRQPQSRDETVAREAGGVTTTITDDAMQRAPVFVFKSAREAREFGLWINENFSELRLRAEATTQVGRLRDIEQYSASRFLFLRFNFTTGDAAGQNMVGKATKAACDWIRSVYPELENYYLESNFATDKKSSRINILHTRGKRVTAEARIPAHLVQETMHKNVDAIYRARQVLTLGGMLAGVNNNGNHSPNGIAAMFIATGQDVANVAESSAAVVHSERSKIRFETHLAGGACRARLVGVA